MSRIALRRRREQAQRRRSVAGVLAAVGGGTVLGLAAPPTGWGVLVWVALVPFLVYLRAEHRPRAFLLGTLAGMVYYAILLRWLLGFHPLTWLGIDWWSSLGIALGAWLFVSASQAWVIGLWASLVVRTRLSGLRRVLFAVGLWVGLHWLWGRGETAFPWGTLAQSLAGDLWAVQTVALGGAHLLVGLAVAVNVLVAESWSTRRVGYATLAALLVASVQLYGWWQLTQPLPAGEPLRIGVIQGNIAQARKWTPDGRRTTIETYVRGYEALAAAGAQLVLTPETAFPFIWSREPEPAAPLVPEIQKRRVPVLLSAFERRADGQVATTLFALDGTARTISTFNKIHLVPFGEQIPLKAIIGPLVRKLSPVQQEVFAGSLAQRLQTPVGPVAAGICFDSAFAGGFRAQVAAGARLLVQSTNDAWYGPAMAPQHHALDTLRAVETGRYLVRASNNGTSAVVDPLGRTARITGWNVYAAFVEPVRLLEGTTLYVRWGDWFVPLSAALALVGLLAGRINTGRRVRINT
ncbi:apolipoprotein N-acyltransferase [Gloeobacter morelensis]|uniref:Apolipoprotein N-acyltransferase n=1 Tax=Gloeobacter morelensis MG652769 TaxID=2781736 RepID=A0ABY3PK00_9CYAN|nr:apolipoprotein N-acyltransferase [Gloeobacter morelensis]UFP93873.1 apolipoprotein N-acyltransferase [Gloeobacter morelensis MG652769]